MNKHLYVWTTQDKLDLAPLRGELVVKIGDAYDVNDRIFGEGIDLSKRIRLGSFDICAHRDYEVHAELSRPIYNIRRLEHHVECETKEAFAVPIDKNVDSSVWVLNVIDIVRRAVEVSCNGSQELNPFIPTTWQRRAIEFVARSLSEGKNTLLLELAARFGKTGTLIQLFDYSDADVMVVASYVKTVNTSFGQTVASHFNDRMTYIDAASPDFEVRLGDARARGLKVVVACALHNSSKLQRRIDALREIPNRLVVVDEADFGSHTPRQLEKVQELREGVPLILMTGTEADRARGSHDVDAHLAVTYFDMLMEAS